MHGKKIRVLVVYHHLPHYRYDVFRQLEQDPALEVEFAAAPQSQDGSIPTIPPSALQAFAPLHNVWIGPLLWQTGLLRLLLRRRPDVVIFLGVCSYLSSWVGAVLTRVLGGEVLHWTIGWHRPDRGLARRLFRLTFYRLATKLLVYGNVGRAIGIEMGYAPDRMTVIYNSSSRAVQVQPADPRSVAAFAERLPPPGREVIGAVLRLNPVKRLDLLVRAAAELRALGRPVEVLLVGQGPEQEALAQLALELEVPLWLPGPAYSDEELTAVYERMLVTVVPSAAGLTVLQSFRFGRPVITHDNMYEQVPECEAIVAGVTGDLYRFNDPQSMRDAVLRWLDRQQEDPDRTASACRDALEAAWNPRVQGQLISDAVQEVAPRGTGEPRSGWAPSRVDARTTL